MIYRLPVAVAIAMGVFLSTGIAQAQDSALLKVNVGILPVVEELPLLISYKETVTPLNRIKQDVEIFRSWTALEAAFRTGMVDAAGISCLTAFKISLDNIPLKIITLLHRGGTSVALAGSAATSLKGSLLGVPGNDTGQILVLNQLMNSMDLTWELDVRHILVPFQRAVSLLQESRINGFVLPEPYATIARKKGVAEKVILGKDILPDLVDIVLIINPEKIDENAPAVQEWVDSIRIAGKFIEDDRQKTNGKQVALLQQDSFGFDPQVFQDALGTDPETIRFDRLAIDRDALSSNSKRAVALGVISGSVDLNKIIDTRFEGK